MTRNKTLRNKQAIDRSEPAPPQRQPSTKPAYLRIAVPNGKLMPSNIFFDNDRSHF
jgi:hypothetical protein